MSIKGYATSEGTDRYEQRMGDQAHEEHFQRANGLKLSSIGVGTYLGQPDDETDRQYQQAVLEALKLGSNVFDTAINYRCMRSERVLGRALAEAFENEHSRDEVIVCTKGGFLPFDNHPPGDPVEYINEHYIATGLCAPEEIAGGCHCISPRYLRTQLERSLENLRLDTVDVYYVHNPEMQLQRLGEEEFFDALRSAFETLEKAVSDGKIRCYGTATWNAYRVDEESGDYVSLSKVCEAARQVAGESHHFRVIQLPYNLGMVEALVKQNQQDVGESEKRTALQVAMDRGLVVMSSASILQGRLTRGLPAFIAEALKGLASDVQRSIQFVRSTPGIHTALVGMKNVDHVRENLESARLAPASREAFLSLFNRESG